MLFCPLDVLGQTNKHNTTTKTRTTTTTIKNNHNQKQQSKIPTTKTTKQQPNNNKTTTKKNNQKHNNNNINKKNNKQQQQQQQQQQQNNYNQTTNWVAALGSRQFALFARRETLKEEFLETSQVYVTQEVGLRLNLAVSNASHCWVANLEIVIPVVVSGCWLQLKCLVKVYHWHRN